MEDVVDLSNIDINDFYRMLFDYLEKLEYPWKEGLKGNKYSFIDDKYSNVEVEVMKSSWTGGPEKKEIKKIDDRLKLANIRKRLHFTGEGDSNQTEFEKLANHLLIGVSAINEKTGKILLRLLRVIIDEYDLVDHVTSNLEDAYPDPVAHGGRILPQYNYPFNVVVDAIAELEDTYHRSHNVVTDGIIVKEKLRGFRFEGKKMVDVEDVIERLVTEIDVWNIYRIFEGLGINDAGSEWK